MRKIALIAFTVLITLKIVAQVPSYVPTNGLVGWWPFTGNANDESGNGNNGTVNGATLTSDRFGNAGKAYSFNGTSNYVDVNNTIGNFQTNDFTISCWIYDTNSVNGGALVSKRDALGVGNYFSMDWVNAPGLEINQSLPSDYYNYNSSLNLLNNWKNYLVLRSGNNIEIYINGSQIFTGNPTIVHNINNTANLTFGARYAGINLTEYINAKLDDIGIWNRALTQQEITALYNSCGKNLAISPSNNSKMIGTNATFTAAVSDTNPSYIWQSNFGQGYVTLNNFGNYSGTTSNAMSISNVQLSNHMVPIRAISVSGNCRDTSNIAYVKITDTCITKITKYDTIKVTDTLVINATLSGVSAPNNTNRLIIYPNPAKDHITIDYGVFGRMSGYTLKIVNTLGQIVFSTPINQQTSYINLSTWTGKGMYYVQIYDASNTLIENRKIVLQ